MNKSAVASTQTIVIRAAMFPEWADLEVECTWSLGGTTFTAKTLRYLARDNNRRKGNIKMGLVSQGDTGWIELNNDDGIQDGEWHAFERSLSVAADARLATVHFNWIYDNFLTDLNMTGRQEVRFGKSGGGGRNPASSAGQ